MTGLLYLIILLLQVLLLCVVLEVVGFWSSVFWPGLFLVLCAGVLFLDACYSTGSVGCSIYLLGWCCPQPLCVQRFCAVCFQVCVFSAVGSVVMFYGASVITLTYLHFLFNSFTLISFSLGSITSISPSRLSCLHLPDRPTHTYTEASVRKRISSHLLIFLSETGC